MADITVDAWQTFDFTTLDTTNLAANDNVADGTWTLSNAGADLSTAVAGEELLAGTINTSLNDASGTRGLAYDLSGGTEGIAAYEFESAHADVSFGFWFQVPSAWFETFDEHDIFYVENLGGVRELYVKMSDDGSDPNLNLFLFTAEQGYSTAVLISADTWYWVTCLYGRTGGVHKMQVYDTNGDLVGAEKTRTSTTQDAFQVSIGSLIGSAATAAGTMYWDDLLIDWADATFPLGPGVATTTTITLTGTATASITEADITAGGKTILATVTNDTYVSDTITPPVIEAADCTISGTNTAQATWAVATPAAVVGDLLIFYIAWDDSTATTDVAEPAGKQSETLIEINATPITDSSTETRAKAWYCICAGTWTAGTIIFTPTATESWSATVIKVPAGEFDGTTPIGTIQTRTTTVVTDTAALSPAMTAGSTDGNGRLIWCAGVDADPLTGTITDWTILQQQDLGAVAHGVAIRDAAVSNSEAIAGGDTWTIAGDSWTSIGFIVRATTASPFAAARQAFITGFDSAQAEAAGWDAEVKAKAAVTEVVRTSSTVATWTIGAQAGYNITAQETITGTIPAAILTGAVAVVATPTFTIDQTGGAGATPKGPLGNPFFGPFGGPI